MSYNERRPRSAQKRKRGVRPGVREAVIATGLALSAVNQVRH